MDPVGPQSKLEVKGDRRAGQDGTKNIHKSVLLNEIEPRNTEWGGGFNTKSGTRKADTPKMLKKWQGTIKGKTVSNHKND